MTLASHEFIRRFLLHVLPKGFHRIRHYGLLSNGGRAENIAKARALLAVSPSAEADSAAEEKAEPDGPRVLPRPCPHCGGRMIVIEVFARAPCPNTGCPSRRQFGSTRHDAVIAVSKPQYWPRLRLGSDRPRRRSP